MYLEGTKALQTQSINRFSDEIEKLQMQVKTVNGLIEHSELKMKE